MNANARTKAGAAAEATKITRNNHSSKTTRRRQRNVVRLPSRVGGERVFYSLPTEFDKESGAVTKISPEASARFAKFVLERGELPADAQCFIELLTGAPDTVVRVRLIDDRPREEKLEAPRLAALELDGPITSMVADIWEKNLQRYGVFLVVNEPKPWKHRRNYAVETKLGYGQTRDCDITNIRACFVDGDDASFPASWHSTPHFVCKREDRWHAYWKITGCDRQTFRSLQRRLAEHYGGDKSIINPARVMRIPGFLHVKNPDAPGVYTLEELDTSPEPYLPLEIEDGLPEITRKASSKVQDGNPMFVDELIGRLSFIDPTFRGDSAEWFRLCRAILEAPLMTRDGVHIPPESDLRFMLVDDWCSGYLWCRRTGDHNFTVKTYHGSDELAQRLELDNDRDHADTRTTLGSIIMLSNREGYGTRPEALQAFAERVRELYGNARPLRQDLFKGQLTVNAAAIQARDTIFLWRPYLIEGAITLLAGRGGRGKGLVSAAVAATVATGGKWPLSQEEEETPKKGRLVLWGELEDPIDTAVVPRLETAGADMKCVEFINPKKHSLDNFVLTLRKLQPALVVLSPLNSFLDGLADINKEQAVRAALEQLQDAIAETGSALLAIGHLNKKPDLVGIERLLGAVAFANFVRSALMVEEEEGAEGLFRLAHVKHNNSRKGHDLLYQIQHVGPLGQHLRLNWSMPDSNVDTATMFDKRSKAQGVNAAAEEWLLDHLREVGEASRERILEEAREHGFKSYHIDKAKMRLGPKIRSQKTFQGPAMWSLAGADLPLPE
jgi:hypothetical protein